MVRVACRTIVLFAIFIINFEVIEMITYHNFYPFDLQRALEGSSIKTRDGRTAVFGAYNQAAHTYCIVGWVKGCSLSWYRDGTLIAGLESDGDLFMSTSPEQDHVSFSLDDCENLLACATGTLKLAKRLKIYLQESKNAK